ncbi:branched-chain amino acid ABC transporter permease [Candidatus Entotheonella palauensis]|uniref:Branched-chain amino acid ABC transporter permease n=1 Tax=Candidatus Entotheonella gemina TaxID=1429439 RepID=W4M355_9BACT|nr:branched-chain amino acid ABC transporter permease [Candidatus Entotheonella palauensis]ETX04077.1 MAG: branched-chain amino acid ABC transporter permease [Candidatus Entotheonella gemina]
MRALTLQKGLTIAGFIILALLPLILDAYQLRLMITFFGFGIALLGFNLLFAYTGLLSFGHALYLALGAYTAAFCTSHFEIYHMEFILLTAIVVAAVVAMITGALCVRYVEVYFAMLTFAFAMLFYTALLKSYHLTGGDEGMPVERPYLLGMDLSEVGYLEFLTGPYYYYALALLILATVIMWRLVRSHFGLSLQAIRENPEKAAFLGIPVHRYRWYAFVIAGMFGAVGGALMAPADGQVDAGLAYWTESGTIVFMALLGGFANFLGALTGALVYIHLLDVVQSLTQYWRFIFGAILALIVVIAPTGLMGLIGTLARRLTPRLISDEQFPAEGK